MHLLEIGWGHGLGSCGAELGQAMGCGNELSGLTKYGELADQLRNEQLLKGSAPMSPFKVYLVPLPRPVLRRCVR
jgi:hypothetical protein